MLVDLFVVKLILEPYQVEEVVPLAFFLNIVDVII